MIVDGMRPIFAPRRSGKTKYTAKICSISGVPRITRMYKLTGPLIHFRLDMRPKAMRRPRGSANSRVKKKIRAVTPMPSSSKRKSFRSAAVLFRYFIKPSPGRASEA